MTIVRAVVFGSLVCWSGHALAEDCSRFLELKRQAASGHGNLPLLYQLDAEYKRCLQTSHQQPVVNAPHFDPNAHLPTPHENVLMRAFEALSKLSKPPPSMVPTGAQLSTATQNPTNLPAPAPAFPDPFSTSNSSQTRSSQNSGVPAGIDLFTQRPIAQERGMFQGNFQGSTQQMQPRSSNSEVPAQSSAPQSACNQDFCGSVITGFGNK